MLLHHHSDITIKSVRKVYVILLIIILSNIIKKLAGDKISPAI